MEFCILAFVLGLGVVTTIIGMVKKIPFLTYLGIAIIFIGALELGTNGVKVGIGSVQDRTNESFFNTTTQYQTIQNWWTTALSNVLFIFSILAIGYHFFEDKQPVPNKTV